MPPCTADDDDDEAVTSLRRLIDVIVKSEHTQCQRNLADVQYQLLSDVDRDESAVSLQVSRTAKFALRHSDAFMAAYGMIGYYGTELTDLWRSL